MAISDTTEQQWTIKKLLEWTEAYFSKVQAASPRLEAEILLAEALECARIELYTRFDEVPDPDPIARFRAWVKRRDAGNRLPTLSAIANSIHCDLKLIPMC